MRSIVQVCFAASNILPMRYGDYDLCCFCFFLYFIVFIF